MFWRKSKIFTIDCLAFLAGLAIAAPFLLLLAAPFTGSL